VSLTVNGQPATVAAIVDSAGPIVTRVVLHPGGPGAGYDTLRIAFSEPVNCQQLTSTTPQSAFVYVDRDTVSAEALNGATFAGTCPAAYVSEVAVLVPVGAFDIVPLEDKIGFTGGSPYVVDTSGARPPLNGPQATIESAAGGKVELAVYPNPIEAGKEIEARIATAYADIVKGRTHGVIIGVNSAVPLKAIQLGSYGQVYGKADLYDAVGNIVRRHLPVEKTGKAGMYGIYWDIKNRNERLVGNGTYLLVVKTTDITGKKTTQRVKIGVRR
jgi:hypothetical protein